MPARSRPPAPASTSSITWSPATAPIQTSPAAWTRALSTSARRLNPDGAELALADKPKLIRSSTRPYPYDEEPIGGLVKEDMDGDGRMLMMRFPDPNGPWKAC